MQYIISFKRWISPVLILMFILPMGISAQDENLPTLFDAIATIEADYPEDEIVTMVTDSEIGCLYVVLSSGFEACVSLEDGSVTEYSDDEMLEEEIA